jgi:DNA-binding CsgD family transcriptional regulator
MKHKHNLVGFPSASGFHLDPALTSEESIMLRTLAAGQTDRQVCNDLRMDPSTFLRMMREMREKIGIADNLSLVAWAKRQMKGVDQRIDKPERYARPA